jgi:hypothetical protein
MKARTALPFVAAAGAALVIASMSAAPASSKAREMYAFRYGAKMNLLVPYDPQSLAPSGPAIRLGRFGNAWSVNADRSRLVAAAGVRAPGEATQLRFVDLEAGRVERTVTVPSEFRRVSATAWVGGRVLAVVAGAAETTVFAIDPELGTVVGRAELSGRMLAGERSSSGLALLLAPADAIGAARITLVDQRASARTVVLERITAGSTSTEANGQQRLTIRRPGTAVSPSGQRLYVVGAAGEPLATVDLHSLAIRYPPVRQLAFVKKAASGSVREAATLYDGRLVVSGFDYGSRAPVGISIVDPATWSRRLIDRKATWVAVSGWLMFTRGPGNVGLRLLRPNGEFVELFKTGSVATVRVVGARALVTFHGGGRKAAVIELGHHRVVGHTVPAHIIEGAGQPITG